MTVIVAWIIGLAGAGVGGILAAALVREQVARSNYRGAKAQVRVTRRIWYAALRHAVTVSIVVLVLLACLYLASTRER